MKQCPTCGSKYPDDFDICNACEVQLIDHKIAKEIHYYGVDNKKLQKKYPEECRIYSEAQLKIQKIRQEYRKESAVTISQSAMPNKPKIEPIQTKNIPQCPTCRSTNVNKISTVKKAAGFLTVGVFSSNLGKTMECKNCGYKW